MCRDGLTSWMRTLLQHRSKNPNADVLSRLPLPAIAEDPQPRYRPTDPSDLYVYFVGASGIHPSNLQTSSDSSLGGLANALGGLANALGGLTATPDDVFSWGGEGSSIERIVCRWQNGRKCGQPARYMCRQDTGSAATQDSAPTCTHLTALTRTSAEPLSTMSASGAFSSWNAPRSFGPSSVTDKLSTESPSKLRQTTYRFKILQDCRTRAIVCRDGLTSWMRTLLQHRSKNPNADVLSRLPLPAIAEDPQPRYRPTGPSDLYVYFVGASGIHPSNLQTSSDSSLGGLANALGGLANALGGLTATPDDVFSWGGEGSSIERIVCRWQNGRKCGQPARYMCRQDTGSAATQDSAPTCTHLTALTRTFFSRQLAIGGNLRRWLD